MGWQGQCYEIQLVLAPTSKCPMQCRLRGCVLCPGLHAWNQLLSGSGGEPGPTQPGAAVGGGRCIPTVCQGVWFSLCCLLPWLKSPQWDLEKPHPGLKFLQASAASSKRKGKGRFRTYLCLTSKEIPWDQICLPLGCQGSQCAQGSQLCPAVQYPFVLSTIFCFVSKNC